MHSDGRFSSLFSTSGFINIPTIFARAEATTLEHWSVLDIVGPVEQFKEAVHVAGILLTESRDEAGEYDFFLAHLLTVGHALKVLLPSFPEESRVGVLRQFWLFVLYFLLRS